MAVCRPTFPIMLVPLFLILLLQVYSAVADLVLPPGSGCDPLVVGQVKGDVKAIGSAGSRAILLSSPDHNINADERRRIEMPEVSLFGEGITPSSDPDRRVQRNLVQGMICMGAESATSPSSATYYHRE